MLLDGKYEVLSLLGAGGMGEVFKARHVHLNAYRCIKVMRANLLADDSYRVRFLREARLATQIHHPNIAVVHDFEILDDGSCYMVTEFIDGITVRQWGAEHGRFPLPLAAEVGVQVLSGLDHIHRRGLLHRDISADNVMLSFDDEDRLVIKIIDLGVAKDVGAGPTDTTQTGMLVGNPKYMSPEQLGELEEGEQLDARADLYCFGVVLYEMLTGVPPFTSKTPSGYIVKHLTEKPPALRAVQPDVSWPDALEGAVLRALEKKRDQRYPDARAFAAALSAFLARPPGTYTRSEVDGLRAMLPTRTMAEQMPTEVVRSDVKPVTAADAFQIAWENGSAAAWQRYLAEHGNAPMAMRARQLLAEAEEFERVSRGVSETALREFLKTWPEGRHRLDAEVRLVELRRQRETEVWQKAFATDSFAAMRDFMIRFPTSEHAEEAEQIANERLAFETAATLDTEESWDEYLANWSGDRHAAAAQERRTAACEREEHAFEAAMQIRASEAWQEFLDRYPSGERAARAEAYRREAIAFETAREIGAEALDRFLKEHPDGLLAKDARRVVKRAVDEADAAEARSASTTAAWRRYLVKHAGGEFVEEAKQHLASMEDESYAALLESQSAERAASFISDYPHSQRRAEVERLARKWRDREADERAWNEAEVESTLESLQAYVHAYPRGRWAGEAKRRIAKLHADAVADEPRDWDRAWEGGTSAAWDDYLAHHAESARAEEARHNRQEAAEFEVALATNKVSLWRAFLKAWPEGRHRLDAEVRLRALR